MGTRWISVLQSAWILVWATGIFLVGGCAVLQPNYETPTVSVRSVRALPTDGMAPRFEIGLHVINPNRSKLALKGISYTVKLAGHRILMGVANDLPVIEAYGEGDVVVGASADLFSSISLVTDLLNRHRDTVPYELEAKLDIGSFRPAIHVEKKGHISLLSGGR